MVFILGMCCMCARTSLLAMFQPLGQITLVNAYVTQRLEVLLIACQTEMRFESPSPYGTSMPESAVKGMGRGHEAAFPLASLPLSLGSPMSRQMEPLPRVCVFVRRGTCKWRLMWHTQLDTHMGIHMQHGALPFILTPAGHLWAANRLLLSLINCLYNLALKWNVIRC